MIREREGRQIEVYYQTMPCVVQESDKEKEGKNMLSDLQPVYFFENSKHSSIVMINMFVYYMTPKTGFSFAV